MSPKKTEFTVHDERNERPMHEKIQTLDFKILRREQHGISLYTIVSKYPYLFYHFRANIFYWIQ